MVNRKRVPRQALTTLYLKYVQQEPVLAASRLLLPTCSQAAQPGLQSASHGPKLTQRQATVEDLDPPAALSLNPSDAISLALAAAFKREYTHLTVVDADTRALVGYLVIPHLHALAAGRVRPEDPLSAAMTRFQRRGRPYRVITMDTPLEELEDFFRAGVPDGPWRQHFAVITDENRRFVLGVATVHDLEEFVNRRPT